MTVLVPASTNNACSTRCVIECPSIKITVECKGIH